METSATYLETISDKINISITPGFLWVSLAVFLTAVLFFSLLIMYHWYKYEWEEKSIKKAFYLYIIIFVSFVGAEIFMIQSIF